MDNMDNMDVKIRVRLGEQQRDFSFIMSVLAHLNSMNIFVLPTRLSVMTDQMKGEDISGYDPHSQLQLQSLSTVGPHFKLFSSNIVTNRG